MLIVPTPVDGYPDESERVALEGRSYGIHWLWNARDNAWAFSIADADGAPILSGVRVVLNSDLFGYSADTRLPGGRLVVIDPSGATEEPTLATLGHSCLPVYVTLAELVEAAA
jgi:hypothetical protein